MPFIFNVMIDMLGLKSAFVIFSIPSVFHVFFFLPSCGLFEHFIEFHFDIFLSEFPCITFLFVALRFYIIDT